MVIRYFAWLRDHTGCAQEQLACPPDVKTISDLMSVISARSAAHAGAFAQDGIIRVAINQEFASFEDAISDEDEIAFFPPITGG